MIMVKININMLDQKLDFRKKNHNRSIEIITYSGDGIVETGEEGLEDELVLARRTEHIEVKIDVGTIEASDAIEQNDIG